MADVRAEMTDVRAEIAESKARDDMLYGLIKNEVMDKINKLNDKVDDHHKENMKQHEILIGDMKDLKEEKICSDSHFDRIDTTLEKYGKRLTTLETHH